MGNQGELKEYFRKNNEVKYYWRKRKYVRKVNEAVSSPQTAEVVLIIMKMYN